MPVSNLQLPDGTYPHHTSIGGYPMMYFDKCGNIVCANCANREIDDAQAIVGGDVYWEGPDIQCDDCQLLIKSAYGGPDNS